MTGLFLDFLRIPGIGRGILYVWQRNLLSFRYQVWTSLLWICLEPLFFLLAIGYGVGSLIGEVQGGSYVEFFVPALMALSAMVVSFYEATYSTYTRLAHQKTFDTILLTPIKTDEVALGEMSWAVSKGLLSACVVAGIGVSQGIIETWLVIPALALVALMAWVFAAIGVYLSAIAKNYDLFLYVQTIFILPMYLFAGTYFPLEVLPESLRNIVIAFPLTQAVVGVRSLLGGQLESTVVLSFSVLFIMALLLTNLACARFSQRVLN